MVEAVGNDRVLFAEQRLEHASVGVETGGEHDRVVLAQVLGDRLLELTMQRLRAANEAHRSHAEAELVHGAARRCDDVRMIGEAEVIVGAEIDRLARAVLTRDTDPPALRPSQEPLAFCKARGLDLVEGGADVVEKGVGHSGSPVRMSASIAAPRTRSNPPQDSLAREEKDKGAVKEIAIYEPQKRLVAIAPTGPTAETGRFR